MTPLKRRNGETKMTNENRDMTYSLPDMRAMRQAVNLMAANLSGRLNLMKLSEIYERIENEAAEVESGISGLNMILEKMDRLISVASRNEVRWVYAAERDEEEKAEVASGKIFEAEDEVRALVLEAAKEYAIALRPKL
jgi:hypothetical protein